MTKLLISEKFLLIIHIMGGNGDRLADPHVYFCYAKNIPFTLKNNKYIFGIANSN